MTTAPVAASRGGGAAVVVVVLIAFVISAPSIDGLRHRCAHDTVEVRRLSARARGRDAVVPVHYRPAGATGGGRRDAAGWLLPAMRRKAAALSTTPLRYQSLRISLSTVDLTDKSKSCFVIGATSPDFQGGTLPCADDADLFTANKYSILVDRVLPAAVQFLRAALAVVPVTKPIIVSPSVCDYVTVPAAHSSAGVEGADFLIYVTAGKTKSGVIAFATPCAIDQYGRPVVGRINVAPRYLLWNDALPATSAENWQLVGVAVHEIMHALGFSGDAMELTWASGYPAQLVQRPIRAGKPATFLASEFVREEARRYFNCSIADGAELEDEGTSGSVGSHWERRNHRDDVMAPSPGQFVSPLTLAFFRDSGHYAVNRSTATEPAWARAAGCDFLDLSCKQFEAARSASDSVAAEAPNFCFDPSATTLFCSPDRHSIGRCVTTTFAAPLNASEQYFAEPSRGGSSGFMDFCPLVVSYSNRICDDGSFVPSLADTSVGNVYGQSVRCLHVVDFAQLQSDGKAVNLTGPQAGHSFRCLRVRCVDDSRIEVGVNASGLPALSSVTWLKCPADGSQGMLAAPGNAGTIRCPTASTFCSPGAAAGGTDLLRTYDSANFSRNNTTAMAAALLFPKATFTYNITDDPNQPLPPTTAPPAFPAAGYVVIRVPALRFATGSMLFALEVALATDVAAVSGASQGTVTCIGESLDSAQAALFRVYVQYPTAEGGLTAAWLNASFVPLQERLDSTWLAATTACYLSRIVAAIPGVPTTPPTMVRVSLGAAAAARKSTPSACGDQCGVFVAAVILAVAAVLGAVAVAVIIYLRPQPISSVNAPDNDASALPR